MPEKDDVEPRIHDRPDGASDEVVAAHGKLSEGLEYVHRVRGAVYEMHQLMGRADFLFEDAADLFKNAGHPDVAAEITRELVGRNVLAGRWTFQVVEEFDDVYYSTAVETERRIRDSLLAGRRHIFESEMKDCRRTPGRPAHERRPAESAYQSDPG